MNQNEFEQDQRSAAFHPQRLDEPPVHVEGDEQVPAADARFVQLRSLGPRPPAEHQTRNDGHHGDHARRNHVGRTRNETVPLGAEQHERHGAERSSECEDPTGRPGP